MQCLLQIILLLLAIKSCITLSLERKRKNYGFALKLDIISLMNVLNGTI